MFNPDINVIVPHFATNAEINNCLKQNYQIEVDKKKIELKDTIKNLGMFSVDIKLFWLSVYYY